MSYQAIARKWRPGTFEEIAGQGHVTRTLQNALRLRRIHHAFLFTGARGVGKTTAARTLARCLNCVNGPTPTPCGECPSCLEVPLGSSPDVTEIDGASNNSVEDVRELRDAVRYLPSRDKHRVYIIDEVHMLSLGAFNALLKTLEEPPAHVIFIFATTEPQKIPDTILSRVQRFDFKRIPESTVVGRLSLICEAEGIQIPEAGMRLIARAGEGSMRDSQSLLDQVIAFGGDAVTTEQVADILGMVDRELLYEFLTGLVRGEPDRCIDVIAKVYDYGYELSQFTSESLELLRNAALVVLSPRSRKHVDVPAEELERLSAICEGLSADTFARYFQAMLAIHDEVSRTSRPRLVLEMGVARLSAIRQLQPIDHLLSRIEGLERRLRSGGNAPRPGPGRGPRGAPSRAPQGDPRQAQRPPEATERGRAARSPRSAQRPSEDPGDADPGERGPPPAPPPGPPPGPPPIGAPVEPRPQPTPPASSDAARLLPPSQRFGAPKIPKAPSAQEPVEDEAPPDPPAPLPQSASDPERFRRFTAYLGEVGRLRLQRFARHLVYVGRSGHALRMAVPPEHLSRARPLADNEVVRAAARALFPGVSHIELQERKEKAQGLTAKERRAQRLAEHAAEVRAEVEGDPKMQQLVELFNAKIVDVKPLSEPEDA